MPRVICELENASDLINGIPFTGEPGQKISDELPDDIASTLATIPGFRIAEPPSNKPSTPGGQETGATGQEGGAGGEGGGDTTQQPEAQTVQPQTAEGGEGGAPAGDTTKPPETEAGQQPKATGKKKPGEATPPAS